MSDPYMTIEALQLSRELGINSHRTNNALKIIEEQQAEIERLKEEVREQKELVQMILAEGYKTRQRLLHKHGVEIIVHESKEVQGES